MPSAHSIQPILPCPAGFDRLRQEAADEGFRFLDRLEGEWTAPARGIGRPEGLLLGAFDGDRLVGLCGLGRDPYREGEDGIGRLRHLYVARELRRLGIGAALVRRAIDHARGRYRCVRLRTDTAGAAAFYVSLGFAAVDDPSATHAMTL